MIKVREPFASLDHTPFWCWLLGHKITGYGQRRPHASKICGGAIDGIGREHCYVYARCDRCDEEIAVINFHRKPLPKEEQFERQ